MAWTYDVMAKSFYRNGKFQFKSMYAGAPGYKDDVTFECVKSKGPLPRGKYYLSGPIVKHPTAGRYVIRLTPHSGNSTCGRDGFLIHGDNGSGTASNGRIVLHPKYREEIIKSGDKELFVK